VKTVIKNGRIVDPATGTDTRMDILIDNGKIAGLEARIDVKAENSIDASDLVVAPGFIDMHVHLREPGQEHKETICTGTRAAARGGFTSVACMPNTSPINDNAGVTKYIITESVKRAVVNVFPIAAVTKGQNGEELTDMEGLKNAGAIAFSDDGHPVANSLLMRKALENSNLLEVLVINHCEDKDLAGKGVMNEGDYSRLYGLAGIPGSSEEVMVSRDIILAQSVHARIHIAHISVKGSAEILRAAKKKGIRVTAEVTPHHLFLTDESLKSHDTNFKMNPPLRSKADVEALIKAVKTGVIDVLATDHAPHAMEEKSVEFDRAPFGIIGLETAVPLFLDRLVHKRLLSLSRFVQMISTNPARILGLSTKGKITIGSDADLTLLDLGKEIVVDVNRFESKSRNSPFHGWRLRGSPVMTIVNGRIVYPFTQ